MTKLLRVVGPSFVIGAEVTHDKGFTFVKRSCPLFKGIIGRMSVKEFMLFLNGTGAAFGWTYTWHPLGK